MTKIVHEQLSYEINGLLYKTQNDLGRFGGEKQYGDYFETLLEEKGIEHQREYRFTDQKIGRNLILEFKTKNFIDKEDYYQVQRYLATLNLELGIIVNFRQKRLVPKRVLNSNYSPDNILGIRMENSGHSD